MSSAEFIASLISSLAWPVVALIAILLFRRSIKNRIEDIRRVVWGNKSVDFGQKLDKIETEAATLIPDKEPLKELPAPVDDAPARQDQRDAERFEIVLEAEPRLAIIDAWASIEREMQRIAIDRGYGPRAKSATFLMRRLLSDGVLDREAERVLEGLRTLRNDVVHGSPRAVSIEDARRYHELSQLIIETLREKD